RVAAQTLLGDSAKDGTVHQHSDGDGDENRAEEPGEEERDAWGGYCRHVLSLRRHDPDQVQRVPAVSMRRVSQLPNRSSPRNVPLMYAIEGGSHGCAQGCDYVF